MVFWNTFRVAAVNSTNLSTFFCHRVTCVVHTVKGVVASTATQLGTAISKYDLTRLSVNTNQDLFRKKASVPKLDENAASQWQVLYLKVIVFFIQTSTLLNRNTAPATENKSWFTEAAADARTRAVSRGLCAGRNTGWAAINVLRVGRAVHCCKTRRVYLFMQML